MHRPQRRRSQTLREQTSGLEQRARTAEARLALAEARLEMAGTLMEAQHQKHEKALRLERDTSADRVRKAVNLASASGIQGITAEERMRRIADKD
jgi:galactokinase